MFVILALPENRHNSPSRSVIRQLNNVDAALK